MKLDRSIGYEFFKDDEEAIKRFNTIFDYLEALKIHIIHLKSLTTDSLTWEISFDSPEIQSKLRESALLCYRLGVWSIENPAPHITWYAKHWQDTVISQVKLPVNG